MFRYLCLFKYLTGLTNNVKVILSNIPSRDTSEKTLCSRCVSIRCHYAMKDVLNGNNTTISQFYHQYYRDIDNKGFSHLSTVSEHAGTDV